ncbi:MAG TPA: hypothetical protein VH008_05135 [Pseudonocardia sp.]|jgi:hypothetical protein|nr:hypothetical protein [Pseudonocardia sp.]
MSSPPTYLSALTVVGVLGILGLTCLALYRGAERAGLGRRRAVLAGTVSAVLLGGWCIASAVIAGHGWYFTKLGEGPPWLPIAVVATLLAALAATRIPLVASALTAPGALERVALPHTFRLAGAAFLIMMALGNLPALFALPAGLGDMATAVAAVFVARGASHRSAVWFNVLGIADLVVALALGTLTGFQLVDVTPSAQAITELPLALIPTVAVPVLIALHLISLRQLAASAPRTARAGAAVS